MALVGGGTFPQPGEISLGHNGVLFLDELPEFKRTILEVMRQPLEDRVKTISRAKSTVDYPASFMLVASMNPCPCGFHNHPEKECVCSPGKVEHSSVVRERVVRAREIQAKRFESVAERKIYRQNYTKGGRRVRTVALLYKC